jgi:hypothetical protein
MRFSVEEPRPLKFLMRDTVVVYASCIIGYYLLLQFQSEVSSSSPIEVFNDTPGF